MPGFANDALGNSIMWADNADFSGAIVPSRGITTNGQLFIGSTIAPNIQPGVLTSPNGTVTVGYSSPNITLSAGGTVATTYNGDIGSATASANILNVLGSPDNTVTGAGNTLTSNFTNRVRLRGGYSENIGISYSAGTFTVLGGDGNALSSTNPGYINLQSKVTPGKQIRVAVTANQTFTDGSAGTIDNQRFGLTTGVNASVDIPFYLYAVVDDTDSSIAFMVTRVPHFATSPASAKIGKSGSVVNNSQSDMFSLANITVTSYDSNPCLCIGSFRMQFVGATDSWTVQTLSNSDGVGEFNEATTFSFPRGQYGAATGKCFANNGGTAPDQTTGGYTYFIQKNGFCSAGIAFPSVDVAGAGAVAAVQVLPIAAIGGIVLYGTFIAGGTVAIAHGQCGSVNSYLVNSITQTSNVGNGTLTNANFSLTSSWGATFYYTISLA